MFLDWDDTLLPHFHLKATFGTNFNAWKPSCEAEVRKRKESRVKSGGGGAGVPRASALFPRTSRPLSRVPCPQVLAFLEGYRDLDAFFLQGHRWPQVAAFFRALGERGWLSLGWPAEAGGGRPIAFEFVLWDEIAYARAARTSRTCSGPERCRSAPPSRRPAVPHRPRRHPRRAR